MARCRGTTPTRVGASTMCLGWHDAVSGVVRQGKDGQWTEICDYSSGRGQRDSHSVAAKAATATTRTVERVNRFTQIHRRTEGHENVTDGFSGDYATGGRRSFGGRRQDARRLSDGG